MFFKKLAAVGAGAALGLGLFATAPAQAAPTGACVDEANWSWSVANPARYINTGPNEVVIGLSDAKRTVTVTAPTGCTLPAGAEWRLSNGYLSAEGTFAAGASTDTDTVYVEKPSSNTVAGDDLNIRLRVNVDNATDPYRWDVDTDDVADLKLLRRTEFKYKTIANRINLSPEPYVDPVKFSGKLLRASWTSNSYVGYEGRNVHLQTRDDIAAAPYGDVAEVTTGTGGSVSFTLIVSAAGGPDPEDTFIGRGSYNGNATSGGTVSIGDRVAPVS